jgi:diguanylate cyclase (GGDEF)-like protein/PAS domain S-box-containing protein
MSGSEEKKNKNYIEGRNGKKCRLFHGAFEKAVFITIIYLAFGGMWIILSDSAALRIYGSIEELAWFSIIKGLVYVVLTGILIFALVYPALRGMQQAIEESKRKERLMTALFDSIPDLIFYKDRHSVYRGFNRAFEEYTGRKKEDLIGKTDKELFDESLADEFYKVDQELIESKRHRISEELYPNQYGESCILETLKTPYYDERGEVMGLIGISRDVTERKQREKEILYLNHHDVLTGLYNRAYVEQALEFLDEEKNLPISIIVVDINGLKQVNDEYGHREGDRLIQTIGDILYKSIDEVDVLGRVAGDEFIIILPNQNSEETKETIGYIRRRYLGHLEAEDNEIHFTSIAFGHATKKEEGRPLTAYVKEAEEFMYQQKLLDFKSAHSSALASIKSTMFEKSNETEEHAQRLAKHSYDLGHLVGMGDEDLVALQLFAMVHDIGKISVDLQILTKEGDLTAQEWGELRKHPETGYRIAKTTPGMAHVAEYILYHHEWWDGTGYPKGLSGESIPLASRILSIVDAYDAMTNDRSYRKAMSHEEAVNELLRGAGTQFDPYLVEQFISQVL